VELLPQHLPDIFHAEQFLKDAPHTLEFRIEVAWDLVRRHQNPVVRLKPERQQAVIDEHHTPKVMTKPRKVLGRRLRDAIAAAQILAKKGSF